MSRGVLVGGVIAALVVGVIVGGLIGWQVEKNRVEDDVSEAKDAARNAGAKNVRPVGVITAVNGNSMTVRLKSSSGSRTFRLTGDTTVERATTAASGNLVKGATVIVMPNYSSPSPQPASEVIVLPSSTKFGGG